ncbi:MAG TPA: hypothetical protein VNA14_02230 [Mycobacteriales bacterium]|nr:hypothetical protein [Mycobacteriales bacterium]
MTAATGPACPHGAPTLPDLWVRVYTRGLPPEVADARRRELASDIYEHLVATSGSRAARRAVVGRTARGVVDDLAWRHEQRQTMKQSDRVDQLTGLRAAWASATQSWFAPAAALCGLFNLGLAIGILLDEESTMPGRVGGPMFLLGFAVCMAAGLRLRWRAGRPGRTEPGRTEPDRASGEGRAVTGLRYVLVLLALASLVLAVVGSFIAVIVAALTILALGATVPSWRRARAGGPAARSASSLAVADALIIIGTLPGFAFFWIVVPALLALVTVVGVVGTGPGARARAAT